MTAMLQIAFRKLSKNKGAMTLGFLEDDTADLMSENIIIELSE